MHDGIMTDRQLDGFACIRCGSEAYAQTPVGHGPRGQLFECSRHHKVVTVKRNGGYAARCECGDITFGGFSTRTEARAALTHETPPSSGNPTRATTRIENPMSPTILRATTPIEIIYSPIEEPGQPPEAAYCIPSIAGGEHRIDLDVWRSGETPSWGVWPASTPEYLSAADATRYAAELQAAIEQVDRLNATRELRRPIDATAHLADYDG